VRVGFYDAYAFEAGYGIPFVPLAFAHVCYVSVSQSSLYKAKKEEPLLIASDDILSRQREDEKGRALKGTVCHSFIEKN